MGPAILIAAPMVTSAEFPALPNVKPPIALANVYDLDTAELKLVDDGSIVTVPVPVNPDVDGAAAFRKIMLPATAVAPA